MVVPYKVEERAQGIGAKNVLKQVDPNGYYKNTMEAILDHKRDGTAVQAACDSSTIFLYK